MSTSINLQSFPDEVLINIFSRLEAVQVAQLQRVCRRWHQVTRDCPLVWRRVLNPELDLRFSHIDELYDRVQKIRTRSGGILDAIGIRIGKELDFYESFYEEQEDDDGDDDDDDDDGPREMEALYMLLDLLPSSNVKTVVIQMDTDFVYGTLLKGMEKKIMEHVNMVLSDCTSLKTLILDACILSCDPRYFSHDNSFEQSKLQNLCIRGGYWPVFFADPVVASRYSSLTRLFIHGATFYSNEEARALYGLIEASQGALEAVSITLDPETAPLSTFIDDGDESVKTFLLPNLRALHVSCEMQDRKRKEIEDGKLLYRFDCPRLEERVSLAIRCPGFFLQDFLTANIKHLQVVCSMFSEPSFLSALQACISLARLSVDCRAYPSQEALFAFLENSPPPSMRELIVLVDDKFNMQRLHSYLRKQGCKTSSRGPLERFVFCDVSSSAGKNDKLVWYRQLVNEAVYLSAKRDMDKYFYSEILSPNPKVDIRTDSANNDVIRVIR